MRSFIRAALISAAALTASTVFAPGILSQDAFAQDGAAPPMARPVKLITLEADASFPERSFFGRVAARRTVDLAFQVPGQIMSIEVEEGEFLNLDQQVAVLDIVPFELTLAQAELELEQAKRAFERLDQLGPERTSQASIDDARTAFQLAEVAVAVAERDLRLATLKSPFVALVARRYSENFSTVTVGQQIVRLHDMSELRVEIEVPEVLFRQARDASEFRIYATLVEDDTEYPLEPREFTAETSEVGQTFTITLAFAGETAERLLPGATVTVTAEPRVRDDAVYVPSSAVVIAPDGATHVMVFEPALGDVEGLGVIRKADIEIEASPDGRLIVISGVSPGDQIVASGADELQDGDEARVFTGFGE